MTTANPMSATPEARAVRVYERLLILYPKPFRSEYSEDMVQAFADLLTHMAAGRPGRVWSRVIPDLVTSATRQRFAQLGTAGGRRAKAPLLIGATLLVGFLASLGAGGSGLVALIPIGVLLGLPLLGLVQLRRASVIWRTTGNRPVLQTLIGLAVFAPVVWWLVSAGESRGYWIGVAMVLAMIWGLGIGAVWGVVTLFRMRRRAKSTGRRWRAIALIVVAVVVLGGMAGAGFNSYLNSRSPPGDHSVKNASAQSRELWDAAARGDVATVVLMINACADPFVHFEDRGRARSNAEQWGDVNLSGVKPAPAEPLRGQYLEIVDRLKVAEDTWTQRCNS